MVLLLWMLALCGMPIYVFESGQPQPSHWLIFILAVLVFLKGEVRLADWQRAPTLFAAAFVGYTWIVSLIWTLVLGDTSVLRAPVYYMFNLMALVLVGHLRLAEGERAFCRATIFGILGAILVQFVAYVLGIGSYSGARFVGTFNNPNQLGYFAILSTLIVIVCSDRLRVSPRFGLTILLAGLMLAILSLSRAAIVAVLGMGLILWLLQVVRRRSRLTALIAIALIGIVWGAIRERELAYNVFNRFHSKGGITAIHDRGYDRLIRFPDMLLFGAGEGALWRFDTRIELHSTPGTLIFSYGVPGTILFIMMLGSLPKRSHLRYLILLLAPLAYSVSHQGLRSTLFWVSIAVVLEPIRRSARTDIRGRIHETSAQIAGLDTLHSSSIRG